MQIPTAIIQGNQAVVLAPGRDFSETLQQYEIHVRNWVKVHLGLHCFKEYFWRYITGFCNPCTACIVQRKKIILGGLMLWAVYRQENFQANICFTWSKPVSITAEFYITYLRVQLFFFFLRFKVFISWLRLTAAAGFWRRYSLGDHNLFLTFLKATFLQAEVLSEVDKSLGSTLKAWS